MKNNKINNDYIEKYIHNNQSDTLRLAVCGDGLRLAVWGDGLG